MGCDCLLDGGQRNGFAWRLFDFGCVLLAACLCFFCFFVCLFVVA